MPSVGTLITASVGVAVFPTQGTTAEDLERLADSALYVAKRSGRDRIEVVADRTAPQHPGPQNQEAPPRSEAVRT